MGRAPTLLHEVAPAKSAAGEDSPAAGPTYRVKYAKDGCPKVKDKLGKELLTTYELFDASVRDFAERPCLAHRPQINGKSQPYTSINYKKAGELAAQVGAAYKAWGLKPGDRVGIFGANSPEWMLAMQGCNRMSLVCVPIYDTLGENAVEYIINHSGAKAVMALGAKVPALAQAVPKLDHPLLGVAYWGEAPSDAVKTLGDKNPVLSWNELLQLGASKPADPVPPKAEELCTIMYTSGTTGDPKGVLHTHHSVLSAVSAARAYLQQADIPVDHNDSYFSFLPLAHIFDRVVEEVMLLIGGEIGYFSGDTRKILEDLGAFRPTVFCGVPRVFERVYSGVLDKVKKAGLVPRIVFHTALRIKTTLMRLGMRRFPLLDNTVFKSTKAALGGRVRGIISGAAPLSRHVEDFLRATMGCPIGQGYGLTETCACNFVAFPNKSGQEGTVGPPTGCLEARLEAVPEMGYDPMADPPRGELCVRGDCLFQGYYKDEEKTKESFDADGFFHTGDVGEWTSMGAMRIIDRKKNIFKLSQGEYIAVEKLENALMKCDLVEQLWLYGNSYESQLVAVVVPDKHAFEEWAKGAGVGGDYKAQLASEAAKKHVLEALAATGKSEKLKGFELPKAVLLESEHFSVENDLMTPKFSLKRSNLAKHYKAQIDEMYRQLKQQEGARSAGGNSKAANSAGAKKAT